MVVERMVGATRDMVALGVVGHTARMSMKMSGYRGTRKSHRRRRYKKKKK